MTFAEKLFALRKEKGLTAKEAAKQVGTSESTLLRMEKGKAQPKSPEMIEAFAKLYGCTSKELTDDSVEILNKEGTDKSPEKAPEKSPKKKVVQIASHGKVMDAVPKEAPEESVEKVLDSIVEELKEKKADTTEIVAENPTEPIAVPAEEPVEKPASTEISPENKTFGEKLHDLRTEKELTLAQIADAVGIKKGAYQGMEYKNSRPTDIKVYDKLAEVLGCEVSYLTAGDERFEKESGEKPEDKVSDEKSIEILAPIEIPTENNTETPAPTEIPTEPTEEIMNAPIEIPTESAEAPAENSTEKTLAEKLKALRQEKKIKLKDLAAQAGLSYDQYKSLEYRDGRPRNVKTYDKLAKVLGCEASYLAEGDKRYKGKDKKPTKKDDVIPSKKPAPAEESISTEEPVPTVAAVGEKSEPIPTVTAMDKASIQDPREIEENIPIDSVEGPVVPAEKSSASSEVIKLVSRLSVLLAGDEISKSEKDAVMVSLNGAYWK